MITCGIDIGSVSTSINSRTKPENKFEILSYIINKTSSDINTTITNTFKEALKRQVLMKMRYNQ